MPICFWLLRQRVCWALALARPKAGRSIPARMAMIAITTSSSMRVKAAGLGHRIPFAFPLDSHGSSDDRRAARKTDEDLLFMLTLSPGFALHWITYLLRSNRRLGKSRFSSLSATNKSRAGMQK